jgi:hypothetical protein
MITTFMPKVEVLLHKSVMRKDGKSKRFAGATIPPTLDLTRFIGDEGRVFVQKSIHQPAGTFSLVLADRAHETELDSMYGLIEPLDRIEIRMAHAPHIYGGKLPIMMRGFVQSIRRAEQMGSDGKPHRTVIVSGTDFGLVFQLIQILNRVAYAQGKALLGSYPLFEKIGLERKPMTPKDFYTALLDNVVNPFLAEFAEETDNFPIKITLNSTVTEGKVYGPREFEGVLWNFANNFADLPWNELFIRDTEKGVELVHRPLPFRDFDAGDGEGGWIAQGSQTIKLPDEDMLGLDIGAVVALTANRSDAHVANLFWVNLINAIPSNIANAALGTALQEKSKGTIYLDDPAQYPNCDPKLYGARPMQVTSNYGWDGMTTGMEGLPKADHEKMVTSALDYMTQKRETLIALNKDNVVFEDGSLMLRGHEQVRAGRYVRLHRGKFVADYYLPSVTHQYIPFQRYVTNAEFIRGTGFLVRSKMTNPYLQEGKGGVYQEYL